MDIKLHYEEKGTGKPLILLHGNNEDGTYFVNQIEPFSKFRRVIAVDTRGHGKSPRGKAPFTIRQFADDLKEFMDGMGIEKADILGFSDGGNIALIFALKYPDMVDKLILNGANLDENGVKASAQVPVTLGYKFALKFAAKNKKARKNAEMLGLMVNDPNISEKSLSKVKAETLVIAGTNDLIKESETMRIHKGIGGSKLAIIEGDHFVAKKNPDEYNRIVESFLKEE